MAPNENPYQPKIVSSSGITRRKRRGILFGVGVLSLLSAALIYLLAEHWTFYTPYSVETSWRYVIPGGSSFSVSQWIAIVAMYVFTGTTHQFSRIFVVKSAGSRIGGTYFGPGPINRSLIQSLRSFPRLANVANRRVRVSNVATPFSDRLQQPIFRSSTATRRAATRRVDCLYSDS